MITPIPFGEVLEAAERLDAAEQAELVAILNRRLAEKGRQRVVDTVEQARQEFASGQCQVRTAEEILREALS